MKKAPSEKSRAMTASPAKNGTEKAKMTTNFKFDDSPSSHSTEEESDSFDDDIESDGEEVLETLEESEKPSSRKRVHESDEENSVSETKRKKKTKHTDSSKPLTVQEMTNLRETENLFHSNLFRLQIDEMLSELRISKKRFEAFKEWFATVQTYFNRLDDKIETDISDSTWLEETNIKNPLNLRAASKCKGKFHFQKPESVFLVGSYAAGCCLGPRLQVDIAVELPEKFFQNGDILNEKYQCKRALYLCGIAAGLISEGLISTKKDLTPHFVLPRYENPLVPVLEVIPVGRLEAHCTVHFHIVAQQETFKLVKLLPSKNTARLSWFFNHEAKPNEQGPPTPIHNSSVLSDLVMKENEEFKLKMLENRQNFKDGIILLKVWLKQRDLHKGFGVFGNYLMSMVVAHLIETKRLSMHMSSYQVTRTVWSYLTATDWTTKGATMCKKSESPDLAEFHKHYDVVFIDVTGYCNLAAHMDISTYQRVKSESSQALQLLENFNNNSFQALFMTPVPFISQFDHILFFHNMKALCKMAAKHCTEEQRVDYSRYPSSLAIYLIMSTLKQGLGDRVAQWGVHSPTTARWEVTSELSSSACGPILLGIKLNSQHAYRIIDKGPPADRPEAKTFREFWGSKSELRRFQDGSISEAIVWLSDKNVTLSQRRTICKIITEYLLEYKLNLSPEKVLLYLADQLEFLLRRNQLKLGSLTSGTGEEATLAILSSYDKLAAELRCLSDLPLAISGIQGSSPVFRYSEVFPPLPSAVRVDKRSTANKDNVCVLKLGTRNIRPPLLIVPIKVVIQLSLSGKWPSDPQAVRRIRAAFNIKISECLKTQCGLTSQAFPDYVDVLKDGFIFRLQVAYQREIALLRQVTLPDGMVKSVDCEKARCLEKETNFLPRITSYLFGLHQQHPAFGPTTCLAKRWFSAHMLDSFHFPEIAIELLVARLFLHPEPHSVPSQPQIAFLRLLQLLSSTNWQLEPIILNFNNEIPRDDLAELEKRFSSNREQLPALFIATPFDREQSMWTTKSPSYPILYRTTLLAAESFKILKTLYTSSVSRNSELWKNIFQPSLESYNAIINLQACMVNRGIGLNKFTGEARELKPYKKEQDEQFPIVGFDTIECYLRELRDNYDDIALFFYDYYGGSVIGVLWKPNALEVKDFKVSHVNGHHLDPQEKKASNKLILNKDALLEDFYIIGRKLVRSIDVQ